MQRELAMHNGVIAPPGVRRRAVILCLGLSVFNCLSQTSAGVEGANSFSLENPKYHAVTVASVGTKAITAQEFLFSYAFGPAFTRREQDSRHRYLNFMIYEKLLALDGYRRRLDTTAAARHSLAEIEGDLATEELFKDDVRSKVRVPEGELRRGMERDRIHLTLRWIFARTEAEAGALSAQLGRGIPFDSLFVLQGADSAARAERSMETTPFRLDLKNPALAAVIDTLPFRAVSSPVRAPDGWYLLKVSDRWTNALPTGPELAQSRSDVERALVDQHSDSLSDLYIKRMMEGERPVIVRKAFDVLHTHLAEVVLGPGKFAGWNLEGRLARRWGRHEFRDRKVFGKEELVTLAHRTLTIDDFLDWYHAREYQIRLNSSTPQAFFQSLEEIVWRMVRDKLLVARAAARNLGRREEVKRQAEWWRDKIVYKLALGLLSDSIGSNDALLRGYFASHRRDFRSAGGDTNSYEQAKDDVAKAFAEEEMTKRLLHRLAALKDQYRVNVREEALAGLPLDDEFDPKAIDVYAVKKGGTFPRPAFPSIDYEWQAWTR